MKIIVVQENKQLPQDNVLLKRFHISKGIKTFGTPQRLAKYIIFISVFGRPERFFFF